MKTIINLFFFSLILAGCASVPMASKDDDTEAKSFRTTSDAVNLYVIRPYIPLGSALKVTVLIDDVWVGDLGPETYLFKKLSPGKHVVTTKSGADDNTETSFDAGKNYYFRQYLAPNGFALQPKSTLESLDEKSAKDLISCCTLIQ